MDKTVLFSYLRRSPFGGRLTQGQVNGVNRHLEWWNKLYPESDIRWVAYQLASVFHETGGKMQPVRETFASSDRQARARLERAWKAGELPWVSKPYWRDGWFGRGDIQITHLSNYRRIGLKLGIDLVNHPEKALDPDISAQIAIVGMVEGLFTGKSLKDYFSDTKDDPVNARKIVNGLDKAKLVASHYRAFYDSLEAALSKESHEMPDVSEETSKPDDLTPTPKESPGFWTGIVSLITGIVSSVVQVSDLYALVGVLMVLLGAGVLAYLYFSGRISFNRS